MKLKAMAKVEKKPRERFRLLVVAELGQLLRVALVLRVHLVVEHVVVVFRFWCHVLTSSAGT